MIRNKKLTVRLSDDEFDDLVDSAQIAGLTISDYTRRLLIPPVDLEKRDELKKIHKTIESLYDKWADVLEDLERYSQSQKKTLV